MTKPQIEMTDFMRVDMRVGTILEAKVNDKARTPAFVLTVDFGELGIKTASAQITEAYERKELRGVQVVAVVNFPPKRVAGIKSEVLILAVVQEGGQTILLRPTQAVANGSRVA